MRKLTKIVAPALVALLGVASLAPTIAEAAPRHHDDRSVHHGPVHHARHAPVRHHVEHRRVVHHRVAHHAPRHYAPVHHDRHHR
jgi:hypothetical protein